MIWLNDEAWVPPKIKVYLSVSSDMSIYPGATERWRNGGKGKRTVKYSLNVVILRHMDMYYHGWKTLVNAISAIDPVREPCAFNLWIKEKGNVSPHKTHEWWKQGRALRGVKDEMLLAWTWPPCHLGKTAGNKSQGEGRKKGEWRREILPPFANRCRAASIYGPGLFVFGYEVRLNTSLHTRLRLLQYRIINVV